MAKKKKSLQMAEPNREEGWFDGKKVIPFSEMTNDHLQCALIRCEKKELLYFNLSGKFSVLVDKLVSEADKRGLSVEHIKTQFTKNHINHLNKYKE